MKSTEMARTPTNISAKFDTYGVETISEQMSMKRIDREVILERMDGDEALMQEIVGLFLDYAPQRRDEIRRALENGDYASLRHTIHAFKGSLGYLDGSNVLNALQHLDQLAVAGDAQRLPAALVEFEQQLDEFTLAVAALVKSRGRLDDQL